MNCSSGTVRGQKYKAVNEQDSSHTANYMYYVGLLRPEQHFSSSEFNPCVAVSLGTGSFTVSVITEILCEDAPLGL